MADLDIQSATRRDGQDGGVVLPQGVTFQEAQFLLDRLRRLKNRRFGRLVIAVSDGRVVDVEVIEKVDREILNRF
jgi:hypothetical protein